jgi:hypothetical protein
MATKIKTAAQITGHGHTRDGRRCFTVASQTQENVWHIVIVNAGHLECDCIASARYGKVCCHRKAVHERLAQERADREAQAATAAMRDTAPLFRSNAPFSIFKQ